MRNVSLGLLVLFSLSILVTTSMIPQSMEKAKKNMAYDMPEEASLEVNYDMSIEEAMNRAKLDAIRLGNLGDDFFAPHAKKGVKTVEFNLKYFKPGMPPDVIINRLRAQGLRLADYQEFMAFIEKYRWSQRPFSTLSAVNGYASIIIHDGICVLTGCTVSIGDDPGKRYVAVHIEPEMMALDSALIATAPNANETKGLPTLLITLYSDTAWNLLGLNQMEYRIKFSLSFCESEFLDEDEIIEWLRATVGVGSVNEDDWGCYLSGIIYRIRGYSPKKFSANIMDTFKQRLSTHYNMTFVGFGGGFGNGN